MSEIKIEKGFPPPARGASGQNNKYPWSEMEVGDSFLVPRIDDEPMQLTRDRTNKAVQWARKTGRTYCTRTIGDTGIRVWRLS